jgi:putative ABC transport system permease protein
VWRSLLAEAVVNLRARRMQAALSAFGIATGIAAVVLLVSLVSGLHRMVLTQLGAAGGNRISVSVQPDRSTEHATGFPLSLRPGDADLVLTSSRYFDLASAENSASVVVRGHVSDRQAFVLNAAGQPVLLRSGTRPLRASVRGLTRSGFEIRDLRVAAGRIPLPAETAEGARVAVLGADLANRLFGAVSPVDESIVLGDWTFSVIGVLAWVGDPTGELSRRSEDRYVYVPFRTSVETFRGNDQASVVLLRLQEPGTHEAAVAEARSILARQQARRGESSGQLQFTSEFDELQLFNRVITGLKLLVGLVGGIGLFVGAVGVANVLLVSVRERTEEIGVRRAVGATRHDVFVSFLVEAVGITLAGGLVGIVAAWLLTIAVAFIPAIPDGAEPHVSLVTALTAVSILVLVGVIAGVGPARRAAAVFPAEALRAE